MRMHADLAARRSRVAAAWLVAVVVTLIAGTAHTAAGGSPPHVTALVAGALVSGFLGMAALSALRTGRLSRLGLAGVVALDQSVQHVAFSLLGPATGSAVATGADAAAGHAAHGALDATTAAIAAAGIPSTTAAPALMTAHHALAALASYLLLRRGAAAVARALQALALAIARVLEPVVAAALPVVVRALLESALPLPSAVVVLGGAGRRGPPVVALAR
jgi:hypothetical protein